MKLKLIQGDVLECLRQVDDGSCDVIYLDPPFFTQKTHKMTTEKGVVISFDDNWETFDEYIKWIVSVVEVCFSKLTSVGTIYSHNNFVINASILSNLPEVLRNKFITNISWQRSHPHNNIKGSWGNIVDSICVFAKSKTPYFKVQYSPLDETYRQNSFRNKDERGYYALAPVTGEKSRVGHKYEYKGYNPRYGWRKKKEDLIELDNQNLLHFGANKIYSKIYAEQSKGVPIQNIWTDIYPLTRSVQNQRKYPTQKPVKLLSRIIGSSCPPGGTILDPFAGSGTSLFAALETQIPDKVILIDRNPQSMEIINKGLGIHRFTLDIIP